MNSTIKQVSRTKAKTNARQLPASAKKFAAQMGLDMKGLEAEAADIWKMLDEMATERPVEYQNFIDQQLQQSKEENGEDDKGRYLRPQAGFSVKGRTTGGDGIKAIQAPSDRNGNEVLDDRHLANDLSIPMLVGVPRDVSESVIAVDILYHPVVIARCLQHKTFQSQIIELGCEWVSQETKLRFTPPTLISTAYMCGRGVDKSVPALFYADPSVVDGKAQPNNQNDAMKKAAPITTPSQVLESINTNASKNTLQMEPTIALQKPQTNTGEKRGQKSQVMIQDLSGDSDQIISDEPETVPAKKSVQFDIKESKTTKKKASEPAIKKGFLNSGKDKMLLYPEGKSNEGQSGGAYARLMEKCIVVNPDGTTNRSASAPSVPPAAVAPKQTTKSETAEPKVKPPSMLEMKEVDSLFATIDDDWNADHSNYLRKTKEEEEAMTSQLSSLAKALCGADFSVPSAPATTTASPPAAAALPFTISHNSLDSNMLTCCELSDCDCKTSIHVSLAHLLPENLSAVDIQVSTNCIRISVPNASGEVKHIQIDTRKLCDVAAVKAKMSKKKGTVDVYIPIK